MPACVLPGFCSAFSNFAVVASVANLQLAVTRSFNRRAEGVVRIASLVAEEHEPRVKAMRGTRAKHSAPGSGNTSPEEEHEPRSIGPDFYRES